MASKEKINFKEPHNYSDFSLIVEGTELHVHRAYLATNSPVFKAMFEVDLKEKKEGRADFKEKSLDVVTKMLHHLYDYEEEIDGKVAYDMISLAHEYEVTWLLNRYETWLCDNKPDVTSLVLAQDYDLKKLHAKCIEKFKEKLLPELEANEDFNKINAESRSYLYRASAQFAQKKSHELDRKFSKYKFKLDRLKSWVDRHVHDKDYLGNYVNNDENLRENIWKYIKDFDTTI